MSNKAHHSNGAAVSAAKTHTNNTSAKDKESTVFADVARNQILSICRAEPGRGKSDALHYLQELERKSKEAAARYRFLSFRMGQPGSGKSKAVAAPTRRPDRSDEEFWARCSDTLITNPIGLYKIARAHGPTAWGHPGPRTHQGRGQASSSTVETGVPVSSL